jgi:hypothetical protein
MNLDLMTYYFVAITLDVLYRIFTLFYYSKCKTFKCNCHDGLTVERDIEREKSLNNLNENRNNNLNIK